MIVKLNIDFNETEMEIFKSFIAKHYIDIDIRLFVDTESLYDLGFDKIKIENPRRMIFVGGFCLLETEDELGTWNMGDCNDKGVYHFWGNYGDLKSTLEGL